MDASQADGWTFMDPEPDAPGDCLHPRIRATMTEHSIETSCRDCGKAIGRVYPGPDEWVSA